MKIRRLDVASRAVCLGCRSTIQLPAKGQSLSAVSTSVFDELPPAVVITEPVRRPKRRLWQKIASQVSGTLDRQRKSLIRAAIALLGILAMASIGVGLYLSREKIPLEAVKTYLKNEDSPDKVLDNFQPAFDAVLAQMESISDERSRDNSTRAITIGPLSEEQFSSLKDRIKSEVTAPAQQVIDAAKRLMGNSKLNNVKLQKSLYLLLSAAEQIGSTLETAWRPIPAPQSASERLAHEIKMIRYRVWGTSYSVNNQRDYDQLGGVIETAANELESILGRLTVQADRLTDASESLISSKYNDELLADTLKRLSTLHSRYGPLGNAKATDRYRDALEAIGNRVTSVASQPLRSRAAGRIFVLCPEMPQGGSSRRLGVLDKFRAEPTFRQHPT
ncbi:MAG: hypothetical protein CBD74_00695 [Saprospirales bacterium TMED214]|nr:MAG: hypothetical protein CBD74_00695 [Saprospirales bacterium TMED214]